jgi:hypothetical protein
LESFGGIVFDDDDCFVIECRFEYVTCFAKYLWNGGGDNSNERRGDSR